MSGFPQRFRWRVGKVARQTGHDAPVVLDVFAHEAGPRTLAAVAGLPEVGAWVRVDPAGAVETLARAGSALAALYEIAAAHGLDPQFPREVLEEVEAAILDPGLDDEELDDQTGRAYVTVDGPGTRDLDQALFCERAGPSDGDPLWAHYAIADASHYCRPGSALFAEALRRGATYYLPGLAVPMLPRAFSEGLVSLNPRVERRALVFSMKIESDGRCSETRLIRAKIRSRAKLTYQEVDQLLEEGALVHPNPVADLQAVSDSLVAFAEIGRRRLHEAKERNVVRYHRKELTIRLGEGPSLGFSVLAELRGEAERYGEQLSLCCNVEGARFLRDGDPGLIQPIYRVHSPPSSERVKEFETLVGAMVRTRGLDESTWRWRPDQDTLGDYLASLPREGPYARTTAAIARQAIMVNVRSTYSASPGRHHGVGADVYGRFSAPMREVVGVFLHKEAWERLEGRPMPRESAVAVPSDTALREQIIVAANRAKQTQRQVRAEANRLVIDQVLSARSVLSGTVMGLTRNKVHVTLDDPPVDVKVYLRHLEEHHRDLVLSEDGVELRSARGRLCALGESVELEVVGREERGRGDRWRLHLASPPGS